MNTTQMLPQMIEPRFVAAAGLATIVTFALFQLMASLVTAEHAQLAPVSLGIDIDWPEPKKERAVEPKSKLQPPPAMIDPTPKTLTTIEPLDGELLPTVIKTPTIKINSGTGLPGLQQPPNSEPSPIVRINPKYPVAAARDGIEGWVQLRFSVDATGAVSDIEVIAAKPQRVFEQEAIRALKRWKYQPSTLDGAAARRTGLQVQLDFSLDAAQ